MNGKVGEIIAHLIRQFLHDEFPVSDEETMVQSLVRKGYSLEDIDAAFELIFLAPEQFAARRPLECSFRVFSDLERAKLSVEARGLLLFLCEAGMLRAWELEAVLLEAAQMEAPEVGLKDVRWLIQQVVNDPDRALFMADSGEGPAEENVGEAAN